MPRLAPAFLLSSLVCFAQTPAFAGPDAMTPQEARHLISRTGFGAAPHEITAFTGMSYEDGVAKLIAGLRTTPSTQMPAWANTWTYPADQIWVLGQTEAELFQTNRWLDLQDLSTWWIGEMVATPSPMTERLTLFWEDHFVASFEAHQNAQWAARKNQFLRANAAGNFATLTQGMLLDPGILVYLDNVSNVADAPNENLGREFLELFTLGEGRGYTQDDVRAAARMLTGYGVDDMSDRGMVFDPELHDDAPKDIFGQSGNYDADDLVALTLAHPEFGPYIVEKLWRAFVSDQPDPLEIARLSDLWKANDLDLAPLLDALLLTDAFWDPSNRGRIVKSPVELVVGTSRSLGVALPRAQDVSWVITNLGQSLFLPPNVAGWPEGVDWITDATASARATSMTYLLMDMQTSQNASAMMVQTSLQTAVTTADANDLRVGQVFATYMEERDPGDGYGGLFMLYDVAFNDHHWRSFSFWMEHNEAEDFTSLYIYTGDCAPDCFEGLPNDGEDPFWVAFEPWDGAEETYQSLDQDTIALMQALATHLPELIASTEAQIPFTTNPFDQDHIAADHAPFVHAATIFARDSAREIGPHGGALVIALSSPDVLGLAGLDAVQSVDDLDAYTEAREEANRVPLIPRVTYETARDWMEALGGSGPETARAAKGLLSVPRVSGEDSLSIDDLDAYLRTLILSPEYQLK